MKDRRCVDDLDIEELERILLVRRREARLAQLRHRDRSVHSVGRDPVEPIPPAGTRPLSTIHRQFQGVGASASYHSVEEKNARHLNFLYRLRARFPNVHWRFVSKGLLLFVETVALVGLVLIAIGTWRDQGRIQAEARELVVLPTATPTVAPPVETVRAVVLPGGHTPPDARGFSQPEPIPETQQVRAMLITPAPLPTRGPEHATRLVIPSIGVDHPVVEGDDWEALKQGVGHTPWSANPGQAGNCVLSAHNDIFGEIFRRLPELALDDEILVFSAAQSYRYLVKETYVVDPIEVKVMDPTERPTLTLISSYPYLVDDQRIVVIAEWVQ
jgi:sortase A